MKDVDAAEQWLDSWVAEVDARATRTVELSRRVAALTGTARSQDRSLTVTVGSSGQLVSLDIGDHALRVPGAELARRLMDLVGRAQAELSAQVAEEVRGTVGLDSETGQAVIHSYATRFPSPPDEQWPDGRG